jgi:hypothetical protein
VLIASSQEDELSFAGRPYSAFTLALIEALCGVGVAKRDGYVRVADLALHAREVVPERTGGRQHPILHFEQADNFALAFYAGGEARPKGLPFTGEPQIEPRPGAWTVLDQRGQTVHGWQKNIAPVLSGEFEGSVAVGEQVEQQFGQRVVISDVSGQVAVGEGNVQLGEVSGKTVSIGESQSPTTDQAAGAERMVCSSCGSRLRPGARFCSQCGTPVGS